MSRQRIVFIIHKLDIGGAERIIVNLANTLNRDWFEVHLILIKAKGEFLSQVASDVTVHDLDRDSAKQGLFPLLKTLYALKPNRIFSGIGYVNALLSLFIPIMNRLLPSSVRWVARETNVVSIINRQEKFSGVIDWLYRHTYKNFDQVICQSAYMRQDLMENYGIPEEKTVIINNPVDIERVQELAHEPLAYAFPKEKVRLLAVGALRTQKRFDGLLACMTRLDDRYHLTIVGGGVEEARLHALAQRLQLQEKVTFVGHQVNPYNFMQAADVMLLTSDYEGFPNVLLEANALGKPIIAYGCPGGTAEIIEEGLNGHLVACQDEEALVRAIERLDTDRFDAVAIQDRVQSRYNLDTIVHRYEEVLR